MKYLFFLYMLALVLCCGCEHTELDCYEGGSSVYFSKESFRISGDTLRYDTLGVIDGDIKETDLQTAYLSFGNRDGLRQENQNSYGIM